MKNRKKITAAVLITALALLTGCGTNPPFSQRDCQGMNAAEVENAFKDAGFTTVEVVETETTDAEKDGTINNVAIDGWTSFSNNSACKSTDAVIITKYVLRTFEPTIELNTEGQQGKPTFTVKTNLPNKTKLTLTISNNDGYTDQQEIQVKAGEATTKEFKQNNSYPLAGDYTITIVMLPENQKWSIQNEVGTNGGALTGDLVKTNEDDGSKYVYYETVYSSPYGVQELAGYIEEIENKENYNIALMLIEEKIKEASGGNYKMTEDADGVKIDLWNDGLALNVVAAQTGRDDNVMAWNDIVDTMQELSESIQKVMNNYGYSYKSVTLNVLNDQSLDRSLLTIRSGEIIYNAVSE